MGSFVLVLSTKKSLTFWPNPKHCTTHFVSCALGGEEHVSANDWLSLQQFICSPSEGSPTRIGVNDSHYSVIDTSLVADGLQLILQFLVLVRLVSLTGRCFKDSIDSAAIDHGSSYSVEMTDEAYLRKDAAQQILKAACSHLRALICNRAVELPNIYINASLAFFRYRSSTWTLCLRNPSIAISTDKTTDRTPSLKRRMPAALLYSSQQGQNTVFQYPGTLKIIVLDENLWKGNSMLCSNWQTHIAWAMRKESILFLDNPLDHCNKGGASGNTTCVLHGIGWKK